MNTILSYYTEISLGGGSLFLRRPLVPLTTPDVVDEDEEFITYGELIGFFLDSGWTPWIDDWGEAIGVELPSLPVAPIDELITLPVPVVIELLSPPLPPPPITPTDRLLIYL